MKAAYGVDGNQAALEPSLSSIASLLNRGDVSLAMIAAVFMKLRELDWEGAARLAREDDLLTKHDPEEPRDVHGRWTVEGASEPGSNDAHSSPSPNAARIPAATGGSGDNANEDLPTVKDGQYPGLEDKYDFLGPIEFAKQVTQFGWWLGQSGAELTAADRRDARTEYAFLQDRLSFWLGYHYKPPASQGNLLSAALTLYEGAINSGVVGVDDGLPRSMVAVAGAAIGADSGQPVIGLRRPATALANDPVPITPPGSSQRFGELGGVVNNKEAGISGNGGIPEQGLPLGIYLRRAHVFAKELSRYATTFDRFVERDGEAISDKMLNTLSVGYIKDPRRIFGTLKRYVDSAADYRPRTRDDLDPADIEKKTIQLAVPEFTSPEQWRQILRAIVYGKRRKVAIVVTRIR